MTAPIAVGPDGVPLGNQKPAAVGVVVGCVPVALALVGPLLSRRAPVGRVEAAAVVVTVGAAVVHGVGDTTLAGFLLMGFETRRNATDALGGWA
jgi:hypothetical protein